MSINLKQIKTKTIFIALPVIVLLIIAIAFAIISTLNTANKEKKAAQTTGTREIVTPLESRQELPKEVKQIKQVIISKQIADNFGTKILFKSAAYTIAYVPTPDIFLVTIRKDPVDQNKEKATEWFLNFGLKEKDLCDLPLRFNFSSREMSIANPNFNQFPDGCQK